MASKKCEEGKVLKDGVCRVPLWKKEFQWLENDLECAKVVAELTAHAGYTETKERLDQFIARTGARCSFEKLKKKGIIQETPSKSKWKYTLRIVTEEGSPYR